MSMIGEYLRMTPAELSRAIADPQWALDHAEQIQESEESDGSDESEQPEEARPSQGSSSSSPAAARHFTTYKMWDMLGFLLRRRGFPVDVVQGEEPFTDEEDWGYGPPRFLTVERVRLAASELSRLSYDDLIGGVSPEELSTAEVYPGRWDSPASLEWARDCFGQLSEFFHAAADAGDAVLVWLD